MTPPLRKPLPITAAPPDAEPIGSRLARLRRSRGLSQPRLSRLSGVAQDTISRLECGHTRIPYTRTLQKLAIAFGMTEAELYRVLGMHGTPLDPSTSLTAPREPSLSVRARRFAERFECLSPAQQDYLEGALLQLDALRRLNEEGEHHAREL